MENRSLRVAFARPRAPLQAWQRRCIDHVRGVDGVTVVEADDASASAACDVLIDLARTDVPHAPRFGVWRYGFCDGSAAAGGAPGTLARLYRAASAASHGVVLQEGWFRAASAAARGTPAVGDRVAPWCARLLRRVLDGDDDLLDLSATPIDGCDQPGPPPAPDLWTVARLAGQRWLRRERWTVGLVAASLDEILDRGSLPEPVWMRGQPADRCYADPFPLQRTSGGLRLLVEDFPDRWSGRVSEIEVAQDGSIRYARPRIASHGHLSYPFVLRCDDGLFCIPETGARRCATAFRFDPKQDAWAFEGRLIHGFAAVDPTFVEHDGRWWLFCTNYVDEDETDLHLFHAPSWRGPWTPHRLNPVKSDARSSRPGGAFFRRGGALYRPAQNCAARYGASLVIHRVVELSERRFREEPVLALAPQRDWAWPDGLHTINGAGDLTVVDALRLEPRLGGWGAIR